MFYAKIGLMKNRLTNVWTRLNKSPVKLMLFSLIAIIISASLFLYIPVSALSGARWGDEDKSSIFYDQKTFVKASGSDTSKMPKDIGLKEHTFIYKSSLDSTNKQNVQVITLDDTEDIASATFHSFNVDRGGNYEQIGETETLEIDGVAEFSSSSCSVEGGGGWAICVVANTLADWMDGLYNIVQKFLDVQPLQINDRSAIFQVWSYMRNIANIAFIIAFIIVIYSQITNFGINNYGIKKILPKLIVAAILINLSYYICAIAIDLSNIAGHQLQNLLISIRKDVFQNVDNVVEMSMNGSAWKALTAGILGGTGVVVWGTVTFFAAGGLGATVLLLLVSLIGVIVSAGVAIIILAARQAIITVLVFLAPLAFAANILPNTEKWFEKWKDLFVTMLVMYPIFALLFGGSQLAGTTIIASANESIITLILGLVVQVIPLAITPFIMQFSGSLLGKIAGMVNDPNKGAVDWTKNTLREEAAHRRNVKIARGNNPNNLVKDGKRKGRPRLGTVAWANQIGYNRSQRHDNMKSAAGDRQKSVFNTTDGSYVERANQKGVDANTREALLSKSTQFQVEQAKLSVEDTQLSFTNAVSQLRADIARETFKTDIKGNLILDADKNPILDKARVNNLKSSMGATSANLYHVMNSINASKLAGANNNLVELSNLSQTLKQDKNLQEQASGARGEEGVNSALASALANTAKVSNEEHKSLQALAKTVNLNLNEAKEIVEGKDITRNGITFSGTKSSHVRMALEQVIKEQSVSEELSEFVNRTKSGKDLYAYRTDVSAWIQEYKKNDYQTVGAGTLGAISRGEIVDFSQDALDGLKKLSTAEYLAMSPDFMDQIAADWDKVGADQRKTLQTVLKDIHEDKTTLVKFTQNRRKSTNQFTSRLRGVRKFPTN